MNDAIRRVEIRGRVQGVGYRAWVEHQARVHGVEGWVRNRIDGSVEALFSGPEHVVADMVTSAKQVRKVQRANAGPLHLLHSAAACLAMPT